MGVCVGVGIDGFLTSTHKHTHTHALVHTYTHTLTDTYIYTHTHTYTLVLTCSDRIGKIRVTSRDARTNAY